MILIKELVTNLEIKSVKDLCKLKPLKEVTSLNINKSEIARELNVDRRTVAKYIDGFQKCTTRKRDNAIKDFYATIQQLLDPESTQVFYYKRVLHQYLKDNHGYTGSYRNFCELLKRLHNKNCYNR